MNPAQLKSLGSRVQTQRAFRNRVVLYLLEQFGLPVRTPVEYDRVSEMLRPAEPGDIVGLPWVVHAHAGQELRLSQWVRDAEIDARLVGIEQFVAVVARKGHPVSAAYAVMPLKVLGHVLRAQLTDDQSTDDQSTDPADPEA